MKLSFFKKLAFYMCASYVLVGCDLKDDPYKGIPAEDLYNFGIDYLEEKNYTKASKFFEEIERRYPYSKWAPKSQVMSAYAHYLFDQYDEAVITLNSFLRLYPTNKFAPYAQYLRGLCFFEQVRDADRDPSKALEASNALLEVVKKYPKSSYAEDAEKKYKIAQDHVVSNELSVIHFYHGQENYASVEQRARSILSRYPNSKHVPEVMYYLIYALTQQGKKDKAEESFKTLKQNFEKTEWYEKTVPLI